MKPILLAIVLITSCGLAQADVGENATSLPRSFQECVERGGRLQESFPATCISQEGMRFTQSKPERSKACVDRCGDGQCQEMVCMAIGCPCAETHQSCPKDCPE
jgi:hypothetical protein